MPQIKEVLATLSPELPLVQPAEEEVESEQERQGYEEEEEEARDVSPRHPDSEGNPADDQFFKHSEMEEFVAQAELDADDPALNPDSSESSSESAQHADQGYSGFFRDPNEQEESEEEPERVFRTALDHQIDQLEDQLVGSKPWQLRGEINSGNRPVDSLLQEDLDFQRASGAAPSAHVPEVTNELEEIIKQRILDMNYDDPKVKITNTLPEAAVKADFLDYEKSKKSLAELYEEDYKKDVLHLPIVTEQEAAKRDSAALWRKLCYNLDLLSSLNPVPRPKTSSDMHIKPSSVPAIAMEEAIPFSVSHASLHPPTSLYNPKDAVLKSEAEFDHTDRLNLRRKSKTALRTRKKERLMKLIEKAAQDPRGEKFEYRRHVKELKAKKELVERKKTPQTKFTRSTEFFKTVEGLKGEEGAIKKRRKTESMKL